MLIARARRIWVGAPARGIAVAMAAAHVIPAHAQSLIAAEPIEEIVVTARKKAEDLLEVPMSVQVLSGKFVEVSNETTLLDLQFEVPGLVITNAGMFGGGFSLRGGEGSIIGVILGAVLLQELQNLVNLLGIPSSLNFAVMGAVILAGVLADQQFNRYRERRRAQQALETLNRETARTTPDQAPVTQKPPRSPDAFHSR